jgi:hypothetical protein
MIGFIAPYTFTELGTTGNTALSLIYALGFSDFTSSVLATYLSQSHYHFKSHSFLLSCHYSAAANSEDSTQFNSSAPKLISRQAGIPKHESSLLDLTTTLYSVALSVPFYNPSALTTQKHSLYCYEGMLTGPLSRNGRPSVARVRLSGMCLPSRCLAMGIQVTIFSAAVGVCHFHLFPKKCSCEDVIDVRVL